MSRIGPTHITCLYVSASVSVSAKHGVIVSSVSTYGMISDMGILCAHIWDRSPSGNITIIIAGRPNG